MGRLCRIAARAMDRAPFDPEGFRARFGRTGLLTRRAEQLRGAFAVLHGMRVVLAYVPEAQGLGCAVRMAVFRGFCTTLKEVST